MKKFEGKNLFGIVIATSLCLIMVGCAKEKVVIKDVNITDGTTAETAKENTDIQNPTMTSEGLADSKANGTNSNVSNSNADETTDHTSSSKYRIEGNQVPVPNVNNFKNIGYDHLEEVTTIIEKARGDGLLGKSENVIFNENANFLNWGGIQCYYDETIFAVAWKEIIDDKYMTFVEVKIADPTQLRRKFADDSFGSTNQYPCSELTNQVHSVVSMNADYYAYRSLGTVVYDGKVCRDETSLNTLFIDGKGDFIYCDNEKELTKDGLQKFVDEHAVDFSISFGPILVRDGKLVDFEGYPIGEANQDYSRSCLCQVDCLHYLFANAGYMSAENKGCTAEQLGKYVYDKGVKEAYTLDGGQTSEVIINGTIFNLLKPEDERVVSDIIYFATALPEN